eukprot:7665329-Pyramimonas_sp.AAC.1
MRADRLAPLDIEKLPPKGVAELASLLGTVESCLAWPRQLPLATGALLGEKSGGDHVIVLA